MVMTSLSCTTENADREKKIHMCDHMSHCCYGRKYKPGLCTYPSIRYCLIETPSRRHLCDADPKPIHDVARTSQQQQNPQQHDYRRCLNAVICIDCSYFIEPTAATTGKYIPYVHRFLHSSRSILASTLLASCDCEGAMFVFFSSHPPLAFQKQRDCARRVNHDDRCFNS